MTENDRLRQALRWTKASLEDTLAAINDALGESERDIPRELADDEKPEDYADRLRAAGWEIYCSNTDPTWTHECLRFAVRFTDTIARKIAADGIRPRDDGQFEHVSKGHVFTYTADELVARYTEENEPYHDDMVDAGWELDVPRGIWIHHTRPMPIPDKIMRNMYADGWRPVKDGHFDKMSASYTCDEIEMFCPSCGGLSDLSCVNRAGTG